MNFFLSFVFSIVVGSACNAMLIGHLNYIPGDTLNDTELIQLFSFMHKEDVSNVRNPTIRKYVIINNFNTIVSITKKQGFPKLTTQPKKRKKAAIIDRCCLLTFHHILLEVPELILNDEIITLFKKELEILRLPHALLQNVMSVVYQQNAKENFFSVETKSKFDLAIHEWSITLMKTQLDEK